MDGVAGNLRRLNIEKHLLLFTSSKVIKQCDLLMLTRRLSITHGSRDERAEGCARLVALQRALHIQYLITGLVSLTLRKALSLLWQCVIT
jgi:hypothetical protein